MEQSYNARCPAVKRLLREAQELHEATEEYYAQPLDDNLFEWHFTVRGPPETEFDGGIYHGRIVMPPEYPMKPPNIIFLTPNGRFETNKKICLSISGHHPETWQPSWSIRTALLAIIGFMPTPANGTIGSLEYTAAERGKLAKKSVEFKCSECGSIAELLRERTSDNAELQREAREVLCQVSVDTKSEDSSEKQSSASLAEGKESSSNVKTTNESSSRAGSPSIANPDPITTTKNPEGTATERRTPRDDDDVIMEGASNPRTLTNTTSSRQGHVQQAVAAYSNLGYLENFVLSGSVFLFIALLIRRLFLVEADVSEELEDILL